MYDCNQCYHFAEILHIIFPNKEKTINRGLFLKYGFESAIYNIKYLIKWREDEGKI